MSSTTISVDLTCSVAGLISGYIGPGSMTVLPAHATAWNDTGVLDDRTLPLQFDMVARLALLLKHKLDLAPGK